MRVYLCTDMEGASGVTTPDDFEGNGRRYEFGRRMLTHDVIAAVEGFREAGATRIVVLDGHGGGGNFIYEDLPAGAEYVCGHGSPQPLPFLDDSFDAVGMIGQHARAGTPGAVYPHTQSYESVLGLWANGVEIGEIGQFAIAAGAYGLPLVFLSGDLAAAEEVRDLCGDVETAAVKVAAAQTRARCLSLAAATEAIREAARRSVRLIGAAKPYTVKLPMELRMRLTNARHAESLVAGGAERVDLLTVRKFVDTPQAVYW